MPKKVAGNPEIDPTMPNVTLKLGGKTYQLVYTFAALAMAERKLASIGRSITLLDAIAWERMTPAVFQVIVFAAVITHHPETNFESFTSQITLKNSSRVFEAVSKAYWLSMSETDPDADPIEPAVQ